MDEKFSGWLGISGINFLIFLALSNYFLNKVHHHWIVPFFSCLLFCESILLSRIRKSWAIYAIGVVFVWVAAVGAILFWRQFSMFECVMHCEGRLSIGLFFLASSCLVIRKSITNPWLRRRAAFCAGFTGTWLMVVLMIGFRRGTLSL